MPHLVSAFRALQQAVPTALSSSYHPIWPLIPSTSIHSSDTSWNFISPKKCPRGLKNEASSHQLISVTQSCPTLCNHMDGSTRHFPVHHQPPELTLTPVHWVGDAKQPSHPVIPYSSHLQSFPASGSLQMSQFFASSGQSIQVSASTSVLPMNIQDWFPLGRTGWIFLQFKGL